jgi:pyridinium-3,5-bisthiocarboxylic acid mononucleotide nickel chelatase
MPIRSDALLLETTLPDAPRFTGLLIERCLDAGAVDAWTTAVVDRNGHPAIRLSLVVDPASRDEVEAVIATNSTASTILATAAETSTIETSSEPVTTRWGDVTITHRRWQGRVIDIEPDDGQCAAYAREHGIPASTVWNEAYRIGEARIGQKR